MKRYAMLLCLMLTGCGTGGGTDCTNRATDWWLRQRPENTGIVWYQPEQRHWGPSAGRALRHCICYTVIDGKRVYYDPQLGPAELTERELESAQHIGP
jgi:hypothetical protein